MITTVTQNKMITIPAEILKKFGIKPGYRLVWRTIEGREEFLVTIIPDRSELVHRFQGLGAKRSPERDIVSELDAEREQEA
jgi:AbrB family looped-hinge helix DNA binding protein